MKRGAPGSRRSRSGRLRGSAAPHDGGRARRPRWREAGGGLAPGAAEAGTRARRSRRPTPPAPPSPAAALRAGPPRSSGSCVDGAPAAAKVGSSTWATSRTRGGGPTRWIARFLEVPASPIEAAPRAGRGTARYATRARAWARSGASAAETGRAASRNQVPVDGRARRSEPALAAGARRSSAAWSVRTAARSGASSSSPRDHRAGTRLRPEVGPDPSGGRRPLHRDGTRTRSQTINAFDSRPFGPRRRSRSRTRGVHSWWTRARSRSAAGSSPTPTAPRSRAPGARRRAGRRELLYVKTTADARDGSRSWCPWAGAQPSRARPGLAPPCGRTRPEGARRTVARARARHGTSSTPRGTASRGSPSRRRPSRSRPGIPAEPATTSADGSYALGALLRRSDGARGRQGLEHEGADAVRDGGFNALAVTLRPGETTKADVVVVRGRRDASSARPTPAPRRGGSAPAAAALRRPALGEDP
jgi:hypothetical protein